MRIPPLRRHSGSYRALLCLCFALTLSACGGDDDADTGGQDPDAGVEGLGPLTLSVVKARRAFHAGEKDAILEVALTLGTELGSAPVSLDPAQFMVKTKSGLYVLGMRGEPKWVDGESCEPSFAVGDGGERTCVVQFSFPLDEGVTELLYRTPQAEAGLGADQREASARLIPDFCEQCDDDCTYTDRDPLNCGSCGNSQQAVDPASDQPVQLVCRDSQLSCPAEGQVVCSELLDENYSEVCTDLRTSRHHCGECGHEVADGDCIDGAAACLDDSLHETCDGVDCVALDTIDNCGSCGKACAGGEAFSGDDGWSCGSPDDTDSVACITHTTFTTTFGTLASSTTDCRAQCSLANFAGCVATSCDNLPFQDWTGGTGDDYTLTCDCYW
jgi:hypothetical protein